MKRFILLILLVCFISPFGVNAASAKLGVYVAPKLVFGYSSGDFEGITNRSSSETFSDMMTGGGLAVGYDLSHLLGLNLRSELEFTMFGDFKDEQSGEINLNSEVSLSTLFLNVYYDFENKTKFTPYVGFGLGIAWLGLEGSAKDVATNIYNNYDKDTQGNFAWNIAAGLGFDLTDTFSLDLGYRYAQYGDGKVEKSNISDIAKISVDNLDMHQVTLGLRVTF